MAYRRRRSSGYNYEKRNSAYTKPYGYSSNWQYGGNVRMANMANCGGKELKYFDSTISTVSTELTTAAGAPNWFALRSSGSDIYQGANLVPNGAGQSQRVGRAIQIHRLQCQGLIVQSQAAISGGTTFATGDTMTWKWVWFLDRQVNATELTDVLARVIYKSSTVQPPDTFYIDPTFKDRYSIIKVKKGVLTPTGGVWDGSAIQAPSQKRQVKFFKKFKEPIEIIYGTTTQNPELITNVLSNNVNCIISVPSDQPFTVTANVRIWYTD